MYTSIRCLSTPMGTPSESRKNRSISTETHRDRAKIDPFPGETDENPGKTGPISPKPGRFSRKTNLVSAKTDQVPEK